ncbi:MAG: plasmid pRiA4b ORF-3 family protein [Bacteroidales bacterium]|jgi:hypothetical protein|nr:plasmid pRiA4b ORF-3 family protein [Bacteroidales bacterium]
MYCYKFRVRYDENIDFVRDIEILAEDHFESFHHILFSSIGLKGNELASFFICDNKWNKQKEITLMDMSDENENTLVPDYDLDDDFSTVAQLPKFVMRNSRLKDMITDPHQHIIYEYDFLNPRVFYVELVKIFEAIESEQYPRCSYRVKELPDIKKQDTLPNPAFEPSFIDEEEDDYEEIEYGMDDEDYAGLNEYDPMNSDL